MTTFEPVAIVGTSCILPGALSPRELWQNVLDGRDLLTDPPPGHWGLDPHSLLTPKGDRVASIAGGYVRGFESKFNPAEFHEDTTELDALFQWVLWGAREALCQANHDSSHFCGRAGMVLGNLGYPSRSMARLAEALWLGAETPDARNRFHFGLPAQLAARALKLGLGGFSIDAACASSLYAMKLACDRLHDRQADLMLAGGINRADDLFLHAGFTALGALSPTGRSRPFHHEADGLVPAEGAAFLVLKRLEDAIAARDTILGVIRGIGCSNDGRGTGLLSPSQEGQVRAIRSAYEKASIDPSRVSYVECHATGTPVGDATEIRSMEEVFLRNRGMPIGSLKSNLGHLITASGAAGVVKLLEALRAGVLPPTRSCDRPSDALRTSGFRVLSEPEVWESSGPRIAAISAFGFGGNNAHVVLEEWQGSGEYRSHSCLAISRKIAITGVGVLAGEGHSTADFIRGLSLGESVGGAAKTVSLPLDGLRFPPRDLTQALPQQLLVLQAAREALAESGDLAGSAAGVFTAMEVDPAITRHGIRWRLAELLRDQGVDPGEEWLDSVRNRIAPALEGPAAILGNMPNMPANRLNSQFDFTGSGFTVGASEASGETALQLAIRAIRCGELDSALVCAVDLSCDPVHQHAVGPERLTGDAAVALVLQPLDDAVQSGRPVYAIIDDDTAASDQSPNSLMGESFAASGLLHIAASAIGIKHRLRFGDEPATPHLPTRHGWRAGSGRFVLSAPSNVEPRGLLFTEASSRLRTASVPRIEGDVAFVFTGAAAAYPGAGRDLLTALPTLTWHLSKRFHDLNEIAGWVYASSPDAVMSPLRQLQCSSFLSQIHAELTLRILKIRPAAMIGLSSGETNSLFAAAAWQDIDGMLEGIAASGMYDREIAGTFGIARRHWKLRDTERVNWINIRVLADAGKIRAAAAGEPRVHLLIVHAPGDCLIGGDAESCRRVIRKLGSIPAYETGGLAVHCPEMAEFAEEWHALHRRPVQAPPDLRIYSNALGAPYIPTDDTVAAILTAQACATVDFPATILRAWEDGVRVFIEHGPRSLCAGWISKTLGDRPHLAVSLDRFGQSSLEQACDAVNQLAAVGVELDCAAFFDRLESAAQSGKRSKPGRQIEVPAHQPKFGLADLPLPAQVMEPAPALPPIVRPYARPPAPVALHANGNGANATLIGAIGTAHREAVGAHVEVLRRTAESRIASFRGLAGVALAPAPEKSLTVGPQFSRDQLEIHASGLVSSLFGPLFKKQDGFRRQVRMPQPPLLFPDRLTGITGQPGSMQTGSVWTETDVRQDSWFLHENHVPPGILIEAGQADLFLISWLGVDFLNRDERVYRMLSCDLTFHGSLPAAGDMLSYDIHIDEHARLGDIRLFFFRFDCRVNGDLRLQMRNGQAGFFSDRELADPAGVIWDPDIEKPIGDALPFGRPDPARSSWSREDVAAFAEGRAYDCFGPGYELLATHTATPRIPTGQLQLIHEIAEFDPGGGPWKRGYMRVVNKISPTDWFFQGHFKNDPCMPGTLMAEAGMQAMAFYMAALGLTLGRDGWRFEPVPNEMYRLRCRGQVVPSSRELTYEIFVHQVIAGPEPAIYADILGTVDGVIKAVHGRRLGLRLVPDWPLEKLSTHSGASHTEVVSARGAAVVNGFQFGDAAMLASAIGRPSRAFGQMYRRFDGPERSVRLPGPPYLMMSRVTRVEGTPESMQAGIECEAECDVDPRAWFFDNGASPMPICMLMEAALQPCGWLASYAGCVSTSPEELYFRNLDGTATMHTPIAPDAGVLVTRARLTSLSRSGGITLVAFDVESRVGGRTVFTMKTGFGFFPKAALASQSGLPPDDEERRRLAEASPFHVDLTHSARMAQGKLLMLDRVTGYWPEGGASKLGRIRAEKDVNPREWFFKAHFFQDPVMPGSLGIESMVQLLQFFMLEARLGDGLKSPRFEPLALGHEIVWKYRGQVIPTAQRITVEMEIREIVRGETDVTAIAEAWLWVDDTRIYQAKRIAMRLVSVAASSPSRTFEIDPDRDVWVRDHCPNYVLPSLPMMDMANRIAEVALHSNPGCLVTGLRELQVRNWAILDRPRRFRASATPGSDALLARLEIDAPGENERYDLLATAKVCLANEYPAPPEVLPELQNATDIEDPYESGALVHGPAFQVLRSLRYGDGGATAILSADVGSVPAGLLPVALLDGALHAIPNDEPSRWSPDIPADRFAFPCGLSHATFHSAVPRSGPIRCEVRFDGMDHGRLPAFCIQLFHGDVLWADLRSLHALFPKGPVGSAGRLARRAFLRDRIADPSLSLSRFEDGVTRLRMEDIRQSDWLPGTVAAFFRAKGSPAELAAQVAIKEHVARLTATHPSRVNVAGDLQSAVSAAEPLRRWAVRTEINPAEIAVRGAEALIDFDAVRLFWKKTADPGDLSPRERLVASLCQQFVRRIRLEDVGSAHSIKGVPVLFLANHQTLLESVLFSLLAPVVTGTPIVALAKIEQEESLLIQTMARVFSTFSEMPGEPILYFNQRDPASLLSLTERLRVAMSDDGRSGLIHVEGGRSLTCRKPAETISAALLELAVAADVPIVPVRFTGGLPVEPAPAKLDFPAGFGKQDYWIGKPIFPDALRRLPLIERKALVLKAINDTGIPNGIETPHAPDEAFAARIARRRETVGIGSVEAVLLECAKIEIPNRLNKLFE